MGYDGVNELADIKSEEIADKIVQDAITPDPGEKPSLVSRFFGIFKRKSKEPEKDIQEPELELVASTEQTEEIETADGEPATIKERIVDFFTSSEKEEETIEEPVVEEIEAADEEPATIKEKIVDFFTSSEKEEDKIEEPVVEEIEAADEEPATIKEK